MPAITITNPRTKEREQVTGERGTCRGCGDPIVWIVNFNGKMQPYNAGQSPDGTCWPHHATCPNRAQFKKGTSVRA